MHFCKEIKEERKKSERLSKNDVSWLLRKGNKFNNNFFSVKFSLNKNTFCRYSVVVSKKTLNLATERNQIRRQFYEILRQREEQQTGFDFIIFIKPTALKLSFVEKQAHLLQTLKQISSNSN